MGDTTALSEEPDTQAAFSMISFTWTIQNWAVPWGQRAHDGRLGPGVGGRRGTEGEGFLVRVMKCSELDCGEVCTHL